jgi:hypothetical protein
MVNLTTIINWLNRNKKTATNKDTALANMLVNHIQIATEQSTANFKKKW